MKLHSIDLTFNDKLSKTKELDKSFCPLEKAKVKPLKDIISTLCLHLEKEFPKSSFATPKTYFIETSTHLKVGVSIDIYHEQKDGNEIHSLVKRFIDLICNTRINLEQDRSFPHDEVLIYLYNKSGKTIKKPIDFYIDGAPIGSVTGMYSDVIYPHKPKIAYSFKARVSDLNHDKRRLSAISPEGRKYDPISFDVDKIFKSLCQEYGEQSVLTFNVTEEYDSKGEPKVTLNSFAKIKA